MRVGQLLQDHFYLKDIGISERRYDRAIFDNEQGNIYVEWKGTTVWRIFLEGKDPTNLVVRLFDINGVVIEIFDHITINLSGRSNPPLEDYLQVYKKSAVEEWRNG